MIQELLRTGVQVPAHVRREHSLAENPPRTVAKMLYSALESQFGLETNELKIGGLARMSDLQEHVAIWTNELADLGVSARIRRATAQGEHYSALLSFENKLRGKVEEGIDVFASQYPSLGEINTRAILEAFSHDAVSLSSLRRSFTNPSEYLDLDSAIHEIPFIACYDPQLPQHLGIDVYRTCNSEVDFREKYALFLDKSPHNDSYNSSQARVRQLHGLSMLLKMEDDLSEDGDVDVVLGTKTFRDFSREERRRVAQEYESIIDQSPILRALKPLAKGYFAFSLHNKRKTAQPWNHGVDLYSAEQQIGSYTYILRQTLFESGALEMLLDK